MRRRPSGFTLLELMIAIVVLVAIMFASTHVLGLNQRVATDGISRTALDAKLHRLLERVGGELLEAGLSTLVPSRPAGGESLDFRLPVGYVDGDVVWGPTIRYEFRAAARTGTVVRIERPGEPEERVATVASGLALHAEGETENGEDDDGDGLVDERGLVFSRSGDVLTVSATFLGQDGEGRPLVRTATASVRPRN